MIRIGELIVVHFHQSQDGFFHGTELKEGHLAILAIIFRNKIKKMENCEYLHSSNWETQAPCMNTHGKNLKAFTSKLCFVNDSRMSSSDTVVLWNEKQKNERKWKNCLFHINILQLLHQGIFVFMFSLRQDKWSVKMRWLQSPIKTVQRTHSGIKITKRKHDGGTWRKEWNSFIKWKWTSKGKSLHRFVYSIDAKLIIAGCGIHQRWTVKTLSRSLSLSLLQIFHFFLLSK